MAKPKMFLHTTASASAVTERQAQGKSGHAAGTPGAALHAHATQAPSQAPSHPMVRGSAEHVKLVAALHAEDTKYTAKEAAKAEKTAQKSHGGAGQHHSPQNGRFI